MKTKHVAWLVLAVLAILFSIAFKYFPYLPGDVSITRFVQSALPESKRWAQVISSTAEMPWIFVLIAVTFLFSWALAGPRAGLLSLVGFIGLWLLGKWLGPAISQPRPSPDLVQVAGSWRGSAFPSIFALNYASTVGYLAVLAAVKLSGIRRSLFLLVCISLLILGWIARVALAAHWPSDVAISYLIGLLWVTLLIGFIE